MAPLKFEDNMREKMQDHTLEPSSKAWDTLDIFLDRNKKNNKKSKRNRMAVAAIFIGVLLTTMLFLKSTSGRNGTNQQIVRGIDTIPVEKTKIDSEKRKVKKIEVTKKIDNIPMNLNNQEVLQNTTLHKLTETGIAETNVLKTKKTIKPTSTKEKRKPLQIISPIDTSNISRGLQAIAFKIKEMQKKGQEVSDTEIEQLLKEAQREIVFQKSRKIQTINPNQLLSEVEAEMDETFKEKVLEALNTGFQKIRTAVVERNR